MRISALILIILTSVLTACSSTDDIKTDTAEGAFAMAQSLEKDKRYEEALTYYADVKNKYPYSRLAIESEMRIADVHFIRESYPEAEANYRLFKELHPRHPKIDYVTYQLGLSIFNQLPSTTDRDLSLADRAILFFDEVVQSHSRSEFAPKAQEKLNAALKMLAEKELYIADYYFKRQKYDSALGRYEDMLRKYPGTGLKPRALYGASVSALKTRDKDKLEKYFSQLKKEFSKTDEYKQAQKIIDEDRG